MVNFGWVFAGPYLASMLGDLGAEVIKVETRSRIDSMRLSPDNLDRDPDRDPWFHSGVRNQLSVTLDMAKPEAVPVIKNLISMSDVVVENFSPRVMSAHGLDYVNLTEIKPDIIMISLPAAGQYGPLRDAQTYGPSLTGLAGVDNMVGYYGERVLGLQQAYADINSSLHGAFAVMTALYYRKRTGKGQHIDMAQMEAVISIAGEAVMEYVMNGTVLGTLGNRHPTMCPHNNYRCKGDDKWVSIAVQTQEEWQAFCQAIGSPPGPGKTGSPTGSAGSEQSGGTGQTDHGVDRQPGPTTRSPRSSRRRAWPQPPAWTPRGGSSIRTCRPGQTYLEVEHPATGVDWVANSAWRLSDNPTVIHHRSPLLGEHNSYVFKELLHMTDEEIARLEAEKVIY